MLLAAVAVLVLPATAPASTLIDRDARNVKLERRQPWPGVGLVHGAGEEVERARLGSGRRPPADAREAAGQLQARLLRRLGHLQTGRVEDVQECVCAHNRHRASLARDVAALRPDGSHWALQSWQRMLPNYGARPTAKQAVWELRLSHWTAELPHLTINLDWAYRKFDHIFGSFTYAGAPVHGFRSTASGAPTRQLWPQHLRRHVQLRLRRRLEAREQLSHSQERRHLLLRLLSARLPPDGRRRALSRHRHRTRRHSRRDVAGEVARPLRQGARLEALRGAARAVSRGQPLQAGVTTRPVGSAEWSRRSYSTWTA